MFTLRNVCIFFLTFLSFCAFSQQDCYPSCKVSIEDILKMRCPADNDIMGVNQDILYVESIDYNTHNVVIGNKCGSEAAEMMKRFKSEDVSRFWELKNRYCTAYLGWRVKEGHSCEHGGPMCCPWEQKKDNNSPWEQINPQPLIDKLNTEERKVYNERFQKIKASIDNCVSKTRKSAAENFNNVFNEARGYIAKGMSMKPSGESSSTLDDAISKGNRDLGRLKDSYQQELDKGGGANSEKLANLIAEAQSISSKIKELIQKQEQANKSKKLQEYANNNTQAFGNAESSGHNTNNRYNNYNSNQGIYTQQNRTNTANPSIKPFYTAADTRRQQSDEAYRQFLERQQLYEQERLSRQTMYDENLKVWTESLQQIGGLALTLLNNREDRLMNERMAVRQERAEQEEIERQERLEQERLNAIIRQEGAEELERVKTAQEEVRNKEKKNEKIREEQEKVIEEQKSAELARTDSTKAAQIDLATKRKNYITTLNTGKYPTVLTTKGMGDTVFVYFITWDTIDHENFHVKISTPVAIKKMSDKTWPIASNTYLRFEKHFPALNTKMISFFESEEDCLKDEYEKKGALEELHATINTIEITEAYYKY